MTDRRYRGWKYGKNITFRAVLTIRISVIHTTGQRTVKDLKLVLTAAERDGRSADLAYLDLLLTAVDNIAVVKGDGDGERRIRIDEGAENELKNNAVTVVNFWFSACAPCIGELGELNALNEELKLKGGAVIGINADTIGGDESMIMEAKNILEKKGAMYQNIYFPADSEAGKLTYSITAFPTTMVVDRNGNMVGEPILGGINSEKQMKALQTMIDEVLARDAAMLDKDMLMKPDGK